MITYHSGSTGADSVLVRATISLKSCADKDCNVMPLRLPSADEEIKKDKPFEFNYTYSVSFVVSVVCVFVRACLHACVCVCACVLACMCVCLYAHARVCACVCMTTSGYVLK